MIKKSTKNISLNFISSKFDFIEDGSMVINYQNQYLLACCKEPSSIVNFSSNLNYKLTFNPIMQGDFPTLEMKIEFYNNTIKVDSISNLISIDNINEIKDMYSFLLNKELLIIIFNKKNDSFKKFEIKNNFLNDFFINLKNFEIDIKDIIKNTNN
ncbi:hypothetical protein CL651_002030 [bacterium]|nr:hypothetical protein [bacterium]